MISYLSIFILAFSFIFISAVTLGQATVVAKDGTGKFISINDAIAAASEYDEIIVRSGEYSESIKLEKKKGIIIKADGDVFIKAKPSDALVLTDCYDIEFNGFRYSIPVFLDKCEKITLSGSIFQGTNGGIKVSASMAIRIYSNTFIRCTSTPIVVQGSQQTRIINNVLYDNKGEEGIRIIKGDLGEDIIQNNTIAYNQFTPIFIGEECRALISNNIISFNTVLGTVAVVNTKSDASKVRSQYNNIFQNKNKNGVAPSYKGLISINDIGSDPLFVSGESRNFALKNSSPCIGKGVIGTNRFGTVINGANLGADLNNQGTPLDFEKQYDEGVHQFKMKKYSQSIQTLERLLQTYPGNVEVLIALGNTYLANKQFTDGISVYERSLKYQPGNQTAFYNLACAYSLQGKISEAIAWLEKAVRSGTYRVGDLESESDFEGIRQTEQFKKLLKSIQN